MSPMNRGAGLGAGQVFGSAGKILISGVMLAGLLFLAYRLIDTSANPLDLGHGPAIAGPQVRIAVPEIDTELLDRVRDGTREQRLVIEDSEEAPLRHLLSKSANVGPDTARALGRPESPIPVAQIQENPAGWRGRYLMYRGTLLHVSPPRDGHPLDGFEIHEGAIRVTGPAGVGAPESDPIVFFQVSRPLDEELGEGSYVEVEGFFFGLRDSNVLVEARKAPMLVGPRVRRAVRLWDPVTELDPAILGAVRDGEWVPYEPKPAGDEAPTTPSENAKRHSGQWARTDEMRLPLRNSQSEPLWHLTSYAQHRAPLTDLTDWRQIETFGSAEQLDRTRLGTFERGTPVRILGEFVFARWLPAQPNPIDVDAWSEVWVQVPDLGGKLLPIWIPGRIEGWQRRDPIEARAYYFRRLAYTTKQDEVFAPVFVAAALDRYTTVDHPGLQIAGWTFFGIVAGAIGFVFWLTFGDRRRQRQTEETLSARRKRRAERQLREARA